MYKATDKQLCIIWHHWKFFRQDMEDKPITDQKIGLLKHFEVSSIDEIDSIHASNYIKNIPLRERSSAGYFELKELEKDWN